MAGSRSCPRERLSKSTFFFVSIITVLVRERVILVRERVILERIKGVVVVVVVRLVFFCLLLSEEKKEAKIHQRAVKKKKSPRTQLYLHSFARARYIHTHKASHEYSFARTRSTNERRRGQKKRVIDDEFFFFGEWGGQRVKEREFYYFPTGSSFTGAGGKFS